jgi:enoyl-CoA hydratase
MDLKAFLKGETTSFPGRGLCGITQTPPRKPLIGAAEGWALAGGFELLLACDLVVAGASARFGVPEVKRGLVAGAGGALLLAQRIRRRSRWNDAHRRPGRRPPGRQIGLVNPVVDEGGALEPIALAEKIAASRRGADRQQADLEQRRRLDRGRALGQIAKVMGPVFTSRDAREGARAFAEGARRYGRASRRCEGPLQPDHETFREVVRRTSSARSRRTRSAGGRAHRRKRPGSPRANSPSSGC